MRSAIVVLSLALVATAGCKKNTKTTAKPVAEAPAAEATPADEGVRTGLPSPEERVRLSTIFFDLDSHTLTPEGKATLASNAEALRDHPEVTVRIEGHADERGSTQYNLALGDRRANSVKQYLTALGIGASRLEVVSYGEERPAVQGHDEAAWSKNRRVELAVTAGADRVSSSYSTTTR